MGHWPLDLTGSGRTLRLDHQSVLFRLPFPQEELGAGPSVGMAPVYYAPLGCTYSIFWPLRTMALGDHVTRGTWVRDILRRMIRMTATRAYVSISWHL